MKILLFDKEKSKHSGYFYREQSGKIVPMGFRDLIDKNVRFSEYDGMIILAHDDEEIPVEETIPFTAETLNSPAVIKYLDERNAIGCLFTKALDFYSQTDVRVLQNHIQIKE